MTSCNGLANKKSRKNAKKVREFAMLQKPSKMKQVTKKSFEKQTVKIGDNIKRIFQNLHSSKNAKMAENELKIL